MEFILFWQAVEGKALRPFDVMLEAKAKDVALLRLGLELSRQQEGQFTVDTPTRKSGGIKVADAANSGHNIL